MKASAHNVRYVIYHCPGCKHDITRTVGKRGEYPRATNTIKSLCHTTGAVETCTKVGLAK